MWAMPQDITDAWIGPDAPDDDALIDRWIGRAERLIRREIPGIVARIDGGAEPDLKDTVVDVVTAMVTRVFRNPEGYRTVSDSSSTGPFSGQTARTFGGDQPGELYLTEAERASLVAPDAASKAGKAYSLRMATAPTGVHAEICSVYWGAPCSCGSDINGWAGPIYEVDAE